jgi:hypothetical protein
MKIWNRVKWIATSATVCLMLSASAVADSPEFRYEIHAGIYSAFVDTKLRVDATNGDKGTTLELENQLGLDDNKTTGLISGTVRITDKHRIDGGFFRLNRDGAATTDVRIEFGDEVFETQIQLNTSFDTKVYWGAYVYSFINDPKKELGVRVGLNIIDMSTRLETTNVVVSENATISAPLPVLGLFGSYKLTDRVSLETDLGWFGIKLGSLEGQWWIANAGVRFHLTEQFAIAGGYLLNYLDMDATGDEFKGAFEYTYQGPVITASYRF